MRRTSVVGPLILIAIGVVFLARNLYPQIPLMDYLARYWPFLLIVWGALRLLEIVFWAANDKPLPVNGVSGGEWWLIVILCIFGSGLSTVWGHNSWWWTRNNLKVGGIEIFGESFEYPISAQKPAGKTPHVVIESFRGNARVTGTDSDEVKVTGRKTIRAMQQSEAQKADQGAPVELVAQGDQIIVRTNQGRLGDNYRLSAEMEIMVPKGASIEAHGRRGDFDITDVAGKVDIDSDNAGVRLQNIGSDVKIETRNGDIVRAVNVKGTFDLKGHNGDVDLQNIDGAVTVTGSYTGTLDFHNLAKTVRFEGLYTQFSAEKIPGQVRMGLGDLTASNLVGPLRLTCTRSRDVQISDFSQSAEISLQRGDIELRPGRLPLAKLEVRTRSGDIELALPPGAKFDLRASTARGEATNDFGVPLVMEPEGRGASIHGAAAGGPTLNLSTDRGSVTVRKATADDKVTTFPDIPTPPAGAQPPPPPKNPKGPSDLKPVRN